MRKSLLLTTAAALIFSAGAFADMKIGVLDLNKVMMSSPQVSSLQAQLKKQFDPRGQEITKMEKSIQGDIDKYNKDSPHMKSDELKKAQDKIIAEQKSLQDLQGNFQRDLMAAQNQSMQTILQKVETVTKTVAENNKLDLIMLKVSVAYSDPKLDVTDQVIAEMKK